VQDRPEREGAERRDVDLHRLGLAEGALGVAEKPGIEKTHSTRTRFRDDGGDRHAGGSPARHATELDAYETLHEAARQRRAALSSQRGRPARLGGSGDARRGRRAAAVALLPRHHPIGIATLDYKSRLATWREWQPVAELAQG
jgi:hypothetical protein